jgi:hypothetical protein
MSVIWSADQSRAYLIIGKRTVCGVHAHNGEEAANVTLTGCVGQDEDEIA